MRLTGRQTMRFETCEDEILELAFTEVRDRKRAPNAYQEALMRIVTKLVMTSYARYCVSNFYW